MSGVNDITELPLVVEVPDQPCQQLFEGVVVLLGFDVVQYHFIPAYNDGGVAVRGLPEYAYNFNGYQFWFSTAENRERFINDPWKYAPAWGGYCSWGVATEMSPPWPWQVDYLGPPASPWEGWLVVNDTLMFNIWAGYSDRFMTNAEQNVQDAIARWKGWFGELHAGPFNTHCIGHGPLKNWCLAQQPSPWLEALPECDTVACNNNSAVAAVELNNNCTGGIISDKNSFGDFENDKYSPHQQTIIKAVSISAFVVLLLAAIACGLVCQRRKGKRAASKGANTTVTDSNNAIDSESTPPDVLED